MRITSGVTATDRWQADTSIHLDPSTTPDQRFLSSLMLCSSCATRRPRVSRKYVLRDKFSTPTGMGDVAHSRDRTSTILVSRAHNTTSMCGHSENQPRNRDQSHFHEQTFFSSWLPIYSCCSLVTKALRFGTSLLEAHRSERSQQCWFSRFPEHPNRNTQPWAQASFVSRP